MEFQTQESGSASAKEESFAIKDFVSKVLNHWYWFLIGVIVCGSLAVLYTQLATPAYKINSEVTVQDQTNMPGSKAMGSSEMMDFSDLLGMPNNAYNEMDILKSKNLMTNTVRALHLNVTTFRKENLKWVETYDEAPFEVVVVPKKDSIAFRKFTVDIVNNTIHLKSVKSMLHLSPDYDEAVDQTAKFGQVIKCYQYDLIVNRKPGMIDANGYKLTIQSVDSKVEELSKVFNVDLTDKKSTTLALSFEYRNPRKGEAILQKLMNLYLEYNLQNKKQIADSTLSFIDSRLAIVSHELTGVESKFTQFKQQNNIMDVDEQSKALVSNVSDYYNKLNEQQVQLSVLDDIAKQVNNPANKRIIPSSLAVQDPVFAAAIGGYNQLLVERGQLSLSYKDTNPVIQNLDGEIEMARQSLLKSFNTYRNTLQVGINALKTQSSSLNEEVKGAPKKERGFLDYAREQNLKEQLYLYLLQKREETAISRTSTLSTATIIDPAKSDYEPYKPNKVVIILAGIALGVFMPWLFIYLRELFNVRILSKEDITKRTKVTILGEIGSAPDNQVLVVEQNSRTFLAEQFRALRTNLQFVLSNDQPNVIMIASSMSGEGKSFITLNLANVLALSGKRVVMIELDLRKPRLSANIGMDHNFGFTNYVISSSLQAFDIIKPTQSENVYIIPSGPEPPNPAELLLNERLGILLNELKNSFDYIIVDTAPIGLVSDAQLIEKYTDISLYITRQGYTYKAQIDILNDLVVNKKFRKAYLVINDINQRKAGYYGYGHTYGYGYGEDAEKPKRRSSASNNVPA
jgi:tyrosine-protein kinase Etk/Wzc